MVDSNADLISHKPPVLYLDWDGVINFSGSRNQYLKKAGFGHLRRGSASPLPELKTFGNHELPYHRGPYTLNWSAELLRKLSALPVEIVVLSTWRHSFSELVKTTGWELDNYRVLDWVDGPKGQEHSGKVAALVEDQTASPSPFIWVDDEAHKFYNEDARAALSSIPQLLIAPAEEVGITKADYSSMLSFLAAFSES